MDYRAISTEGTIQYVQNGIDPDALKAIEKLHMAKPAATALTGEAWVSILPRTTARKQTR